MCDSSITERDPVMELALSHDLTEPSKPHRSMESLETRTAKVKVTTMQKLAYEAIVSRRIIEPSDSDPNNPEKPGSRGCRQAAMGRAKIMRDVL